MYCAGCGNTKINIQCRQRIREDSVFGAEMWIYYKVTCVKCGSYSEIDMPIDCAEDMVRLSQIMFPLEQSGTAG